MLRDRADKIILLNYPDISRSKAQDLIKRGKVLSKGELVTKCNQLISSEGLNVNLKDEYVSRGAHKLKSALDNFHISVGGFNCADFGASTGGFVQILLERGAKSVIAIDVGHSQLHASLQTDHRVKSLEGINLKDEFLLDGQVDLIVADLSFISLEKVWHNFVSNLKFTGIAITLFKPQFQVGKSNVGKGGLVKNRDSIISSLQSFVSFVASSGLVVNSCVKSAIKGGDGNQEYLLLISHSGSELSSSEIQKVVCI